MLGESEDGLLEIDPHLGPSNRCACVRLPEQAEVTAAHQRAAVSHQAHGATADVASLPGCACGHALGAEQAERDVARARTLEHAVERAQAEAEARERVMAGATRGQRCPPVERAADVDRRVGAAVAVWPDRKHCCQRLVLPERRDDPNLRAVGPEQVQAVRSGTAYACAVLKLGGARSRKVRWCGGEGNYGAGDLGSPE